MKTTLKHYIALVPMGGKEEGKIAQHSTDQESIEKAAQWARDRFNRSAVVVEMNEGEHGLPLNGEIGNRRIFMVTK